MKRQNARLPLSLLILAPLLSACAQERSSQAVLPDVSEYSKEVQALAASELESYGPPCPRDVVIKGCNATHRIVIDTLTARDQTRAIANGK